ncbi:hypothetical protein Q7P37_006424 [Cladosporium fusiforme]
MRVLDTTSLDFEDFPGRPSEPYVVLSHRWGTEEVTFKEYRKNHKQILHRAGYRKIVEFCQVARARGFRLAWLDTCCIDKRSSAELSEAINSMYDWYKHSAECYVWLEDYAGSSKRLGECGWFGRGWTLQELLAPSRVIVFTANWEVVGHKIFSLGSQACICHEEEWHGSPNPNAIGSHIAPELSVATGIPQEYLTTKPYYQASIALRMSWASGRRCSRPEDRAYSLLGLFDVNLPLLYGEGYKSFEHLQDEIMRKSDDTSILCHDGFGILANGPSNFSGSGGVTTGHMLSPEPHAVTNRGIKIHVAANVCTLPRCEPDAFGVSGKDVFRINLGCVSTTAQPTETRLAGRPSVQQGEQYLYLIGIGASSNRTFFRLVLLDGYRSALERAVWVDAGEMLFYVVNPLRFPAYQEKVISLNGVMFQ